MMIKCLLLLSILPVYASAVSLPDPLAVPGGIVHIPLGDAKLPMPQVFYQNHRVLVTQQNFKWLALVGIPLDATLGQQNITIKTPKGDTPISFQIMDKKYPAQYLKIKNKRMVNPNAADEKRISDDRIILNKALSTWTEQATVDTDFIPPVEGRLSSLFGLKRFFNKQAKDPHGGLDIAASAGTPIKAPATARVIDTGNFYYNGNTVLLDHGQGLISGYFHMTEIHVKPGQQLKQGDILGTVGKTGRVTGPHLHWNIYLNNTKIDPALFIARDIARLDARNK
ncbi:peptidoglycan DD-metalloendopeptidase family protein [Crenothrix sp.]|uniref:peptidoglycan DD-metalloendopeptidase family protein n=1 Tax=Crenothrix sp. TaxID=3100433 RepID=UPI00374D9B62